MRSVFMGSPEFAVPALRALAKISDLVGVVTQPDRPTGRGRRVTPPPVKIAAQELGAPYRQPEKLRDPETMRILTTWQPEVIVVAAYGQILRPEVLSLPPHGCVNLHASLLPRHRGAAPIPAAILAGDLVTGITLMQMDPGLDTGPILAQKTIPIGPRDTTLMLTAALAQLAAATLVEYLPVYMQGGLTPVPQNAESSTYAPQLKKEDGLLEFSLSADVLERRIRAYQPWPGAFFLLDGAPLKVVEADFVPQADRFPPGFRYVRLGEPMVSCKEGALRLRTVQPAGKRAMSGVDYIRGAPRFSEEAPGNEE